MRDRLLAGVPLRAQDLAQEFSVSDDAIRRDLRALAKEGVCQRVYGGALPLSPAAAPLVERVKGDPSEKIRLARCALSLLRPGTTLFLDSSSTNLHLARLLPGDLDLRVITNSVLIAVELIARPEIETSILGGRVNTHVGGRVDGAAVAALADYSIDLGFLGACAYDPTEGLAGFERDDVLFKRAVLRAARATAILMTTEKLGTHAPYRICPARDIGTFVLSEDAPKTMAQGLMAIGAAVRIAPNPLPLTE